MTTLASTSIASVISYLALCTDFFAPFPAPMLDDGHLMAAAPNNQLHQGSFSDFADDLWQSTPDVYSAPVNLSQSSPSLEVFWPTIARDPPCHGGVLPATLNYYQKPGVSGEELLTAGTYHIKPTCLLPDYNGGDTNFVNGGQDPQYQRDPRVMRECLMLQAEGKPLNEAFRKSAKDVVASPNTRKASCARRKYAAKFKCPIDGCNDDFTRKHNLDSESKKSALLN
jgi:hypothetical protein